MKSYYMWTGVGEIEDFDGEGGIVAVDNRMDAVALFTSLVHERKVDATLWERDGTTAKLLAARFGYEVFLVRDPDTVSTYVTRKFN